MKAQFSCGTLMSPNDYENFIEPVNANTKSYTFLIQIHVINNSDGTGGATVAEVQGIRDRLHECYSSSLISFVEICETDFINSDIFANTNYTSIRNSVFDVNRLPNVINIYLFPLKPAIPGGTIDGGIGGIATLPDDDKFPALWIGDDDEYNIGTYFVNSNIICHEMGHIFNLLHIHAEFDFLPPAPISTKLNPSTLCSRGDKVCDTAPSFNIGALGVLNNACDLVGYKTGPGQSGPIPNDPDGFPYTPDPKNYMSNSRSDCIDAFTFGQTARVRNAAEAFETGSPIFDTPNDKVIVGNNTNTVFTGTGELKYQTIYGTIVVAAGSTLILKDKTFYFAVNSGIRVDRGGHLIIDNAILTRACNEPWSGIFVEGYSDQIQVDPVIGTLNSATNGAVTMKNNSSLEFSYFGLNATEPLVIQNQWQIPNTIPIKYNSTKNGGLIKCDNSSFRNNGRSAFIARYDRNLDNKSYFNNCEFTGSLPTPYVGENKGLVVHETQEIEITNCRFNGLTTAFESFNASVWIHGGDSEFSQNTEAIRCLSTHSGVSSITIEGEENNNIYFFDNLSHIRADALTGVSTNTDGFTMRFCHIDGTNRNHAPSITGASKVRIIRNRIEGTLVFGSNLVQIGEAANLVSCNNYTNNRRPIWISGDAGGLQIISNQFTSSSNVDIFNASANIPDQGKPDNAAGNCFTSTAKSWFNFGNPSLGYYVLSASAPGYLPCMEPNTQVNSNTSQQSELIECSSLSPPKFNNPNQFILARNTRDSLKMVWQLNPASSVAKTNYQIAKSNSFQIFDNIARQYILNGAVSLVASLGQLDTSACIKQKQLGFYLLDGNIPGAQSLLPNVQFMFESTDTFHVVQGINMQRLISPNFVPNQSQKEYLCYAAARQTTGGADALGLLYYFGLTPDCNNNNLRELNSKNNIDNLSEENSNCLFPNPATLTINISKCLTPNISTQISIYDQVGRLVQAKAEMIEAEINISNLAEGVYILQIQQGIELKVYKFVKQ